jgi:hypothetical protein
MSPLLKAAAYRHGAADIVIASGTDYEPVLAEVIASVNQIRISSEPVERASWAAIEITIDEKTVDCVVRAGKYERRFLKLPWSRRSIALVDESFAKLERNDSDLAADGILERLAEASQRLLFDLFETPLNEAMIYCGKYTLEGALIHCRFVVRDGDLEFVPFELVATANDGQYLRAVRPLARKLIPKERHGDPDRDLKQCPTSCRVLYITSDVKGTLSVAGHEFKGRKGMLLRPLDGLTKERDSIRALYPADQLRVVELESGKDNIKEMEDAFGQGPFDVVHFAGHSARSDTNEDVFLALPGRKPGSIIACNAEDFAQMAARADVRLVLLSSCEGTSCRALSRMASFGVPAVAGFRWPVDDTDAAEFTPTLHAELRNGSHPVPIIQAFHKALLSLKKRTEGRLGWYSPVLMVQRSAWHEFGLQP